MTGSAKMEHGRQVRRYRVIGMDCAHDAAQIEARVRRVAGVESVRVSAATHILTLEGAAELSELEGAVEALGYGIEPAEQPAHEAPGYRRALGLVVILNLGYGVVEMVGGFLAGSQALKADALDFLGDGLITGLALLAIGWPPGWRARAALLQGVFLGVLGIGVLVNTAYRMFAQQQPSAEAMGALGIGAMVVNVAAAAVLMRFRAGDASVRAVWLFSRNDALGNVAVVVAAGAGAVTGSVWPDLVVGVGIGGIFLWSSLVIVGDGWRELVGKGRT